ncbi:MAG TPA: formyltransferase [Deltaproteobacteria bacterium]|nr:formyltransferase [Deltaproteobacteria bacterium]HQI80708.1 formyltransferase [Deltaproteobacteria bacterium]
MRAVVFAYHNMGRLGIQKLLQEGFEIPLVFTHEDDPGESVWFGSVSALCRALAIEHATPADPASPEWMTRLESIRPDIMFSFYYRSMLPERIIAMPPYGAYNLHGSLLPAYRGRCPVNWVIINGERHTGVTLHAMTLKPDAGPIVGQRRVEIGPDDTAFTLFGRLEQAAGILLDELLPGMRAGKIPLTPQDLSRGSYFGGRRPEDGRISWSKTAQEIYNLIRGVTRPYPGAFFHCGKRQIIIWRAAHDAFEGPGPGVIFFQGGVPRIGTSQGSIVPLEVELERTVITGSELETFFRNHEGEVVS